MPSSPPPPPTPRTPRTPSASRTPATPSSSRSRTRSRAPSTPLPQRGTGGLLSPGFLSPPINRPGSASSHSTFNSGTATPTRTPTPTPPGVMIGTISGLQDEIRAVLDSAISRDAAGGVVVDHVGFRGTAPTYLASPPLDIRVVADDDADEKDERQYEDEGDLSKNNDTNKGSSSAEAGQDGYHDAEEGSESKERKRWDIPTVAWNRLTTPLINIDHRITSIVKPFAHFLQVIERHESSGHEGRIKVEVLEKQYPKSLSKRYRRRLLLQLENTFQPLNRSIRRRLPLAGEYLRGYVPEGDEDDDENVTVQKVRELSQCFDVAAEEVVGFCQSDSVQRVIDIMNQAAEDNKPLLTSPGPASPSPSPLMRSRKSRKREEGSPSPSPAPEPRTPKASETPTQVIEIREEKPSEDSEPKTPPGEKTIVPDNHSAITATPIKPNPPSPLRSRRSSTSSFTSSNLYPTSDEDKPTKGWRDPFWKQKRTMPANVPGTDKQPWFLLRWCAPDDFVRMRQAVRRRVVPEYTDSTGRWFLQMEEVRKWIDGAKGEERENLEGTLHSKVPDARTDDDDEEIPKEAPIVEEASEGEQRTVPKVDNRVLFVKGAEFTGKTTLSVRLYDHLREISHCPVAGSSEIAPTRIRTIYSVCHDFDRRYWGRLSDSSAVGNIIGQVARQLVEEDPVELCKYVGDVVELNPRLGNPIEAMRGRGNEVMEGLLSALVGALAEKDVRVINIVMIVRPGSKAEVVHGSVSSLLKLKTDITDVRICVIGPSTTFYRPEDLFKDFPAELPTVNIRPDRQELMQSALYMAEWFGGSEGEPANNGVKHWRGPLSKLVVQFFGVGKDGRCLVKFEDGAAVPAIASDRDVEEARAEAITADGEVTYVAPPRCEMSPKSLAKATQTVTTGKDSPLSKSVAEWTELYNFIMNQKNPSYYQAFLQIKYYLTASRLPPTDLDTLLDWTWSDYMSSMHASHREAAADVLLWVIQKCIMKEIPNQGIPDILSRTTGAHLSDPERWSIAGSFYRHFYPSRQAAYSSIQCILVHFTRRVFGISPEEVCERLADRSITYGVATAAACNFSSYDLFVSGRMRPAIAITDTIVGDVLLDYLDEATSIMADNDLSRLHVLKDMWSRLESDRKAFEYYIWVQGEWQERFVVGGVRAKLLHLAARNGNENIVRLLLHEIQHYKLLHDHQGVDAKSGNDWTALHLAAEMGHDRIVQMLLDAGANFELNTGGRIMKNTGAYGQTSSTLAAVEGHDKVVRLLVEAHVKLLKDMDAIEENDPAAFKGSPPPGDDEPGVEGQAASDPAGDETKPSNEVVKFDPNSTEAVETTTPQESSSEARWKNLYAENRVIIWSGAVNGRENILLNLFHDLANRNLIDAKFTRVSAFLGAVRYGHYNLVILLLSWDPRMAHMPFQQWEGTTCLHLAVSHPRVLQYLLKNGARAVVNTADNTGRTPLDQAIKAEMERSVELLLDAGADVRCTNHQGQSSALTLAARTGYEPVLRILLERCADDFKQYSKDKRGPIHMSAFSGCTKAIEMLVEYGFDPTVKDESGCYAPEAAALGGSVDALKFLWDQGYCAKEPNARYQPGNTTLLHLAVENGNSNPDMIKFLLANGADINVADDNGRTPLHAAVLRDDLSIAELLMRRGAKADIGEKPALCVAAALGKGDMVHLMLKMGSNIDCTDCQGSTAISLAGMGGKGSPHIVRELIDAGADLEKPDHQGRTPLNYFCSVGLVAIECVVALLEAGADTGALDHNENSSLHRAVSAGGLPLLQLLLKHGADPNITTITDQYTPLHVAARNGQLSCVLALLHAGAKVDSITKNLREAPLHPASFGGHADIVKVLLSNGADPNRRCHNDYRSGPLHDAALKGHARVVEELLDGGADVSMYSKYSTALHYATRHAEVVRVLLDRGADVHAREIDEDGDTVLHVAVIRADDPGILRMLVGAGADTEARNSNGETPLMLAVRVGQEMPARVLLELGADVDAREGGTTAMMLAVRKNDRRMVRLLRRWGARGA